jgi:hypothetical protein
VPVVDLLIVYLAFGSPSGVYHLAGDCDRSVHYRVAMFFFRLATWPFSLAELTQRVLTNPRRLRTHRGPTSEHSAVAGLSATDTLRLKFLSDYLRDLQQCGDGALADAEHVSELFEVVRHPRPDLASACLRRRRARKINEHSIAGRAEITAIEERAAASNSSLTEIGSRE